MSGKETRREPSQTEQRQALLDQLQKKRDGSLAYRAAMETHALVQELLLLKEAKIDTPGICSLASLTLLFGPEAVPMSEGEQLKDTENHLHFIWENLKPLVIKEGWDLKIPGTSHEFVTLMETSARGALIYSPDHVVGAIPTWSPEQHELRRRYIVIDTNLPEISRVIDDEGLIDLYTDASIFEHSEIKENSMLGLRWVIVFTQDISEL